MRSSSLIFGLAPLSVLAQDINITETNDVNLANGTGNLGWGATNLPFGYSAGVGFNFAESTYFIPQDCPPQNLRSPILPHPPLLLSPDKTKLKTRVQMKLAVGSTAQFPARPTERLVADIL